MDNATVQTTRLTITVLERLLKSNFRVEGTQHMSADPTLYVINHFTRAETFIIPYITHKYTGHYCHSLADGGLFKGWLGKYLNGLGVLSTRIEGRDDRVIGDLMTGRRNWIIYPEGVMVKSKALMRRGRMEITTPHWTGPPRRGAAVLALKAEIYKGEYLAAVEAGDTERMTVLQDRFAFRGARDVGTASIRIVPVTISYYPLRPGQNVIRRVVKMLFKDLPASLEEELEIEGNLLLRSTDINVHFGAPIVVRDYLGRPFEWSRKIFPFLRSIEKRNMLLGQQGARLTKRFMGYIYANLKINIDHLFCSALRLLPDGKMTDADFCRALYLTAADLRRDGWYRLHRSLDSRLIEIVAGGDYAPWRSICDLAESVKVIHRIDDEIIVNKLHLNSMYRFHSVRLENPIIVMANELEPLKHARLILRKNFERGADELRARLAETVHDEDRELFRRACERFCGTGQAVSPASDGPFFLPSREAQVGVVLAHGYLAVPEQSRPTAEYLHQLGYTVYGVRLPGHGTTPENLAHVSWQDWCRAYLRGVAVLRNSCRHIVLGGYFTGGLLALLSAARVNQAVLGVFAINPPLKVGHVKTAADTAGSWWSELLRKFGSNGGSEDEAGNHPESEPPQADEDQAHINGRAALEALIQQCQQSLGDVAVPAMIVQSEKDLRVDPTGAGKVFSMLGCEDKSLAVVDLEGGASPEQLHSKLDDFLRHISREP